MKGTTTRCVLTVSPSMNDVKRGVWIQQMFTDVETAHELYRKFTDMGLYCCIRTQELVQLGSAFSHKEFRDYWM